MTKILFLFLFSSFFLIACDDSGGSVQKVPEICDNHADDDGDGLFDCDDPDCETWVGCQNNNVNNTNNSNNSSCGNFQIDDIEECDGTNYNGKSCIDYGYISGILHCNADCTVDVSDCVSGSICGDSIIEAPDEDCEGSDLGDETCESQGYYGGTLACDSLCKFDFSSCLTFGKCGDGVVQTVYGEECEGADINGETCESIGFYGGQLQCKSDCTFDTVFCLSYGTCGDNSIQEQYGEECDGVNLGTYDCTALGYYGGDLDCNSNCTFNTSGCASIGRCGDGILQSQYGESCDGTDLGGMDCAGLNYYGGILSCDNNCGFDISDCAFYGKCGDDVIQGSFGEVCDGTNISGTSCNDLGYYGGELACSDCNYDTSSCESEGRCGDGVVQSTYGETCDSSGIDTALCNGGDCTDAFCGDGYLNTIAGEECDSTGIDTATCDGGDCTDAYCGDGYPNSAAGEQCDDGNLNDTDGCTNSCQTFVPRLCSEVASDWCTAKGWQVVGTALDGNIVCTIDGRSTGNNCDTCSTYNIIVWQDGSKERHCTGYTYSTQAGKVYSAHTPCTCGDNLDFCSNWDMESCIPD